MPGQWTIIYYVGNWKRYQMYYGVRAQLVDTRDGSVLWSTFCQANQDDRDAAPSMEELMANESDTDVLAANAELVTARWEAEEVESLKSLGARGVISKPYNPLTLHEEIEYSVVIDINQA